MMTFHGMIEWFLGQQSTISSQNSSQISLDDMPDLVLQKIFKPLDFESIIILRKVCRRLRDYIDKAKPDSRLKAINIKVSSTKITMNYLANKWTRIEYEHNKYGCMVKEMDQLWIYRDIKRKYIKNEDFQSVFFNDLHLFLKHQKSIFERVIFNFTHCHVASIFYEFLTKIEMVLQENPIKSMVFHTVALGNQEQIMSILQYFDENILKEIMIQNGKNAGKNAKTLDIDQILKLSQWKKSEILTTINYSIPRTDVRNFSHFKTSEFHLETISSEDLFFLKEKFLHTPTFKSCIIHFKNLDEEQKTLNLIFRGNCIIDLDGRGIWYFRIPGTKDIIYLTLDISMISFYRKPFSSMEDVLGLP